jgi:hypothetical protein
MDNLPNPSPPFYDDMRRIILEAKLNAVDSADYDRMRLHRQIGQRILVEEQKGQTQATHGDYM